MKNEQLQKNRRTVYTGGDPYTPLNDENNYCSECARYDWRTECGSRGVHVEDLPYQLQAMVMSKPQKRS